MEWCLKRIIGTLFLIFSVNAEAVYSNNAYNNNAALELLIWQAREGGADNWAKTISPTGIEQTAQLADAPFNWNEGLRLSIEHIFSKNSDVKAMAKFIYF